MPAKKKTVGDQPILARNRAAAHEYHLLQRIEAGIALTGAEVKSARLGRVNLRDGYARIRNGQVLLYGVHFSPYTHARTEDFDPVRTRTLLLHAREIRKLAKKLDSGGATLVPTKLYLKQGRIKIELALAQGKRAYDKREDAKRKIMQREIDRARGQIRD